MKLIKALCLAVALAVAAPSVGYTQEDKPAAAEEAKPAAADAGASEEAEAAPAKAEAKESSETNAAPMALLSKLLDAYKSKNWNLAVAVLLMLLLWAWNVLKFTKSLPKHHMAKVSVAVAIVGGLATNLMAGGSWISAGIEGVLIGAAAAGLWSLGGKKVLSK